MFGFLKSGLIALLCIGNVLKTTKSSGLSDEEVTDCLGYIGVAQQLTATDAQAYCQRHFESDLATILNDVDNVAVRMAAILAGIPSTSGLHIGLHDISMEGNFEWMDGTPVDYLNWNDGEPNNIQITGEDCVAMRADRDDEWNDISCTNVALYFVCNYHPSQITSTTTNAPSLSTTSAISTSNTSSTSSPTSIPTSIPTKMPTGAPTCAPTAIRSYIGVFTEGEVNYFNASNYCRDHFGTELATIGNAIEDEAVRDAATLAGIPINEDVWIGLNDLDIEGDWSQWNDGTHVEYENWSANEPNNFARSTPDGIIGEDCGHLWATEDGEWKNDEWNDDPCFFEKYFVCNLDPISTNITTNPSVEPSIEPSVSPTSTSNAPTNFPTVEQVPIKYIGVTQRLSTTDAQAFCQENFQSDLATILSDEDNDAVREAATLAGIPSVFALHIGLHDVSFEGRFEWMDGTSVSYLNWNAGEPNNIGGEDCVEMRGDASNEWNDIPCTELQYFVCNLESSVETTLTKAPSTIPSQTPSISPSTSPSTSPSASPTTSPTISRMIR